MPFLSHSTFALPKINENVWFSRSGYTGEDGFELLVAAEKTQALTELLLADKRIKPCGLGARNSLRIEAGLLLHGNIFILVIF